MEPPGRLEDAAGRPAPDREPPSRPEQAVGRPAPDLSILSPDGSPVSLRSRVGRGPLVLFFYIHNGTPG
jgi:hypothetical protein